ncbi:MAG: carbohydrate kinase family protein [Patescibacteria group bacterium]
MKDVITFGSATQDIYAKSRQFLSVLGKSFKTGEGICLTLGSKIELDDISLTSGGGGTNSAATFANQGLKVAYCGQVGEDCFGNLIFSELKNLKIDTEFISKSKNKLTSTSVFLAYPGRDQTALVYRGASDDLDKKDMLWQEIKKTKWFYLAPFSGKLSKLTEDLVDFAKKYGIKVAWNPGYNQLKFPQSILERIFKKIDILILNRQEASLLTKISFNKEKDIFRKLYKMTKGIVIMTKGKDGAVVLDSKYLYKIPTLKLKFTDATGAGDAFGSGFVAGIIDKNDIIFAMQLAMANSGFCVSKWGAKTGLLKKGQRWPKVKIVKEIFR